MYTTAHVKPDVLQQFPFEADSREVKDAKALASLVTVTR